MINKFSKLHKMKEPFSVVFEGAEYNMYSTPYQAVGTLGHGSFKTSNQDTFEKWARDCKPILLQSGEEILKICKYKKCSVCRSSKYKQAYCCDARFVKIGSKDFDKLLLAEMFRVMDGKTIYEVRLGTDTYAPYLFVGGGYLGIICSRMEDKSVEILKPGCP
jgi:hypothetical protein